MPISKESNEKQVFPLFFKYLWNFKVIALRPFTPPEPQKVTNPVTLEDKICENPKEKSGLAACLSIDMNGIFSEMFILNGPYRKTSLGTLGL